MYPVKQQTGPYKYDNTASATVMRLSNDLLNTGRNITADNYFTSIPFPHKLLNKRTTLVDTLGKKKREIPPLFLNTRIWSKPSNIFGFHNNKILLYHIPNEKKRMFSRWGHITALIQTGSNAKSEIITYYNKTKGRVDVVYRLKDYYSVARVACRCPLRLFFFLLNIAGLKKYHNDYLSNSHNHKFIVEVLWRIISSSVSYQSVPGTHWDSRRWIT